MQKRIYKVITTHTQTVVGTFTSEIEADSLEQAIEQLQDPGIESTYEMFEEHSSESDQIEIDKDDMKSIVQKNNKDIFTKEDKEFLNSLYKAGRPIPIEN